VVIVEGDEAVLGREKFGTFQYDQWDYLREGRRGSSQITLVFSRYIDKAHRAVIFAIAQLSCYKIFQAAMCLSI